MDIKQAIDTALQNSQGNGFPKIIHLLKCAIESTTIVSKLNLYKTSRFDAITGHSGASVCAVVDNVFRPDTEYSRSEEWYCIIYLDCVFVVTKGHFVTEVFLKLEPEKFFQFIKTIPNINRFVNEESNEYVISGLIISDLISDGVNLETLIR